MLLAENLPRDPPRGSAAAAIIGKRAADRPEELHATGFGEDAHASESRQSWMLIGMAVRVAYGLELDKVRHAVYLCKAAWLLIHARLL